jgi:acetoacetate decarboxylase
METSLELKEELKKSQPSLTEAGLQGRLKKSQLPYAMGDLYRDEADNDGRSRSGNNDIVVMVYLTPAAAAAALLPSEFSLPKLPAAGELTPVSLAFAKQGESRMIRPYNEVAVLIPCLYNGQSYSYCPYNWVDTEQALVCGREFFGFPAKLATFDLKRSVG